ncbi:hypothetical protein BN2497_6813 [Janthinobacterium sp. CG23_2]|nr:hypothetical protein BN2497_6813 [Janthinobacterium sp. CG23_2]CUU29804.1 hypothetical protein BN3177_6813 [Janthinobacterium sp. CG23_2]
MRVHVTSFRVISAVHRVEGSGAAGEGARRSARPAAVFRA